MIMYKRSKWPCIECFLWGKEDEAHFLDVEPYRKKSKLSNAVFIPLNDERRKYIPESHKMAKEKDTLWIFGLFVNNENKIPM